MMGQAGVEHLSSDDFHRMFISDLLDPADVDALLKEIAGHASVDTTVRYDRRPEAEWRKSVEVLHHPYISARRQGP
jgi:integrase